jgi:hypothetical protein
MRPSRLLPDCRDLSAALRECGGGMIAILPCSHPQGGALRNLAEPDRPSTPGPLHAPRRRGFRVWGHDRVLSS